MNETEIKAIHIADFDYPLPDGRIAKHPLTDRAACKLLAADNRGNVNHTVFSELPGLLRPDTIICCNDTRVINARIEMHKPTGSRIEIFLLEPVEPHDYVLMFQEQQRCVWRCLVGNRKRWKEGELVKEIDVNGPGGGRRTAPIIGPTSWSLRVAFLSRRTCIANRRQATQMIIRPSTPVCRVLSPRRRPDCTLLMN